MKPEQLLHLADTLEKVAEYIDTLETEISEKDEQIEKAASVQPETKAKNDLHEKLASIGFTDEEIEMMDQLPDTMVTKMASAAEQPWGLGQGAGPAREKTDPFLEFLVG